MPIRHLFYIFIFELGLSVFNIWFKGINANITKQIKSSTPTAGPFTTNEYIIGDIPTGAY